MMIKHWYEILQILLKQNAKTQVKRQKSKLLIYDIYLKKYVNADELLTPNPQKDSIEGWKKSKDYMLFDLLMKKLVNPKFDLLSPPGGVSLKKWDFNTQGYRYASTIKEFWERGAGNKTGNVPALPPTRDVGEGIQQEGVGWAGQALRKPDANPRPEHSVSYSAQGLEANSGGDGGENRRGSDGSKRVKSKRSNKIAGKSISGQNIALMNRGKPVKKEKKLPLKSLKSQKDATLQTKLGSKLVDKKSNLSHNIVKKSIDAISKVELVNHTGQDGLKDVMIKSSKVEKGTLFERICLMFSSGKPGGKGGKQNLTKMPNLQPDNNRSINEGTSLKMNSQIKKLSKNNGRANNFSEHKKVEQSLISSKSENSGFISNTSESKLGKTVRETQVRNNLTSSKSENLTKITEEHHHVKPNFISFIKEKHSEGSNSSFKGLRKLFKDNPIATKNFKSSESGKQVFKNNISEINFKNSAGQDQVGPTFSISKSEKSIISNKTSHCKLLNNDKELKDKTHQTTSDSLKQSHVFKADKTEGNVENNSKEHKVKQSLKSSNDLEISDKDKTDIYKEPTHLEDKIKEDVKIIEESSPQEMTLMNTEVPLNDNTSKNKFSVENKLNCRNSTIKIDLETNHNSNVAQKTDVKTAAESENKYTTCEKNERIANKTYLRENSDKLKLIESQNDMTLKEKCKPVQTTNKNNVLSDYTLQKNKLECGKSSLNSTVNINPLRIYDNKNSEQSAKNDFPETVNGKINNKPLINKSLNKSIEIAEGNISTSVNVSNKINSKNSRGKDSKTALQISQSAKSSDPKSLQKNIGKPNSQMEVVSTLDGNSENTGKGHKIEPEVTEKLHLISAEGKYVDSLALDGELNHYKITNYKGFKIMNTQSDTNTSNKNTKNENTPKMDLDISKSQKRRIDKTSGHPSELMNRSIEVRKDYSSQPRKQEAKTDILLQNKAFLEDKDKIVKSVPAAKDRNMKIDQNTTEKYRIESSVKVKSEIKKPLLTNKTTIDNSTNIGYGKNEDISLDSKCEGKNNLHGKNTLSDTRISNAKLKDENTSKKDLERSRRRPGSIDKRSEKNNELVSLSSKLKNIDSHEYKKIDTKNNILVKRNTSKNKDISVKEIAPVKSSDLKHDQPTVGKTLPVSVVEAESENNKILPKQTDKTEEKIVRSKSKKRNKSFGGNKSDHRAMYRSNRRKLIKPIILKYSIKKIRKVKVPKKQRKVEKIEGKESINLTLHDEQVNKTKGLKTTSIQSKLSVAKSKLKKLGRSHSVPELNEKADDHKSKTRNENQILNSKSEQAFLFSNKINLQKQKRFNKIVQPLAIKNTKKSNFNKNKEKIITKIKETKPEVHSYFEEKTQKSSTVFNHKNGITAVPVDETNIKTYENMGKIEGITKGSSPSLHQSHFSNTQKNRKSNISNTELLPRPFLKQEKVSSKELGSSRTNGLGNEGMFINENNFSTPEAHKNMSFNKKQRQLNVSKNQVPQIRKMAMQLKTKSRNFKVSKTKKLLTHKKRPKTLINNGKIQTKEKVSVASKTTKQLVHNQSCSELLNNKNNGENQTQLIFSRESAKELGDLKQNHGSKMNNLYYGRRNINRATLAKTPKKSRSKSATENEREKMNLSSENQMENFKGNKIPSKLVKGKTDINTENKKVQTSKDYEKHSKSKNSLHSVKSDHSKNSVKTIKCSSNRSKIDENDEMQKHILENKQTIKNVGGIKNNEKEETKKTISQGKLASNTIERGGTEKIKLNKDQSLTAEKNKNYNTLSQSCASKLNIAVSKTREKIDTLVQVPKENPSLNESKDSYKVNKSEKFRMGINIIQNKKAEHPGSPKGTKYQDESHLNTKGSKDKIITKKSNQNKYNLTNNKGIKVSTDNYESQVENFRKPSEIKKDVAKKLEELGMYIKKNLGSEETSNLENGKEDNTITKIGYNRLDKPKLSSENPLDVSKDVKLILDSKISTTNTKSKQETIANKELRENQKHNQDQIQFNINKISNVNSDPDRKNEKEMTAPKLTSMNNSKVAKNREQLRTDINKINIANNISQTTNVPKISYEHHPSNKKNKYKKLNTVQNESTLKTSIERKTNNIVNQSIQSPTQPKTVLRDTSRKRKLQEVQTRKNKSESRDQSFREKTTTEQEDTKGLSNTSKTINICLPTNKPSQTYNMDKYDCKLQKTEKTEDRKLENRSTDTSIYEIDWKEDQRKPLTIKTQPITNIQNSCNRNVLFKNNDSKKSDKILQQDFDKPIDKTTKKNNASGNIEIKTNHPAKDYFKANTKSGGRSNMKSQQSTDSDIILKTDVSHKIYQTKCSMSEKEINKGQIKTTQPLKRVSKRLSLKDMTDMSDGCVRKILLENNTKNEQQKNHKRNVIIEKQSSTNVAGENKPSFKVNSIDNSKLKNKSLGAGPVVLTSRKDGDNGKKDNYSTLMKDKGYDVTQEAKRKLSSLSLTSQEPKFDHIVIKQTKDESKIEEKNRDSFLEHLAKINSLKNHTNRLHEETIGNELSETLSQGQAREQLRLILGNIKLASNRELIDEIKNPVNNHSKSVKGENKIVIETKIKNTLIKEKSKPTSSSLNPKDNKTDSKVKTEKTKQSEKDFRLSQLSKFHLLSIKFGLNQTNLDEQIDNSRPNDQIMEERGVFKNPPTVKFIENTVDNGNILDDKIEGKRSSLTQNYFLDLIKSNDKNIPKPEEGKKADGMKSPICDGLKLISNQSLMASSANKKDEKSVKQHNEVQLTDPVDINERKELYRNSKPQVKKDTNVLSWSSK